MDDSVKTAGPQDRTELLPASPKFVGNAGEPQSQQKDLTALLAMEGGQGEGSYAKNSRAQAAGLRFVQPILEAAIDGMHVPAKGLVKIADLGCSSGPNSVKHMNLVVRTLRSKYAEANQAGVLPEFQVFFVDLLSNDFNSLFRLINHGTMGEESGESVTSDGGAADYFSAGVAGSFYGRVLPRGSLDVVFSSFSLHWLSKIPDAVQRPDSPAFNNGFVWIHGGKAVVGEAYAQQAKSDMCHFLRARAEEMVPGGLMFLLLKGRKYASPTTQYDPEGTTMFGRHMEEVFNELVMDGLLDAGVRDSFNLPIYCRTVDEMREAVDEVSEFQIERVELLVDVPGNAVTREELQASPADCGKRVAQMCRSLLGGLVESHMGVEVANEFFLRLEKKAIVRSKAEVSQERQLAQSHLVAVLVRK